MTGARAAILWLVGEHCDKKGVSKIAPDVLRMMAKTFPTEVHNHQFTQFIIPSFVLVIPSFLFNKELP